ncbi:TPA: HNH endonuclease family protein, partial [Pluralibacter gergoviae]
FVEYVSDNLLFIKITATNDLSAFLIFETLNDRGLALSVTDLLKNFIFSIVDDDDREHIKNKWNQIISQISYQSFPRFLRHFWMIKHGHIQEKDLFKTIKREIKNPIQAFELMNELEELSEVYAALGNPNAELWVNNKANFSHIKELDLFKVTQCYPLIMASFKKFPPDEFTKVLRICTVISFRYLTIAGQNPNAMEKIYSEISQAVNSGTIVKAASVFDKLKSLYINDDDFIRYFEDKSIKTKRSAKLARYILYKVENHLNNTSCDFENDPGTLEHILPENPLDIWDEHFPQDIQESFIYRIGNFTILEPNLNKVIGNDDFSKKKSAYEKSRYFLSKSITYNIWNEGNLRLRQKYLAKQAKAIWSLSY